jgi:hypothetical protein
LSAVNRIPEAPGLMALGKPRTHVAIGGRVAKKSKANQAIAAARARGPAELPSFAIKGGGDSLPSSNGTDQHTPAVDGAAASQPPVSFSFAASGQSQSRSNRYRGGVYMAAPF